MKKNNAKWQRIPREYANKAGHEIKAKYLELVRIRDGATGMRYYEISDDLGYLENCYHAVTGEWLRKPRKARAH